MRSWRGDRLAWASLASAVVVGSSLRFWGLRYGLPYFYFDPEPHVLLVAYQLGPRNLDPGYFSKPSLLMYLLSALFGALKLWPLRIAAASAFDPALATAARAVCAAFSCATIPATAWLAREAGASRRAAALAALSQSAMAVDVYYAHFVLTDSPMTLFMTLGLGFCCRIARQGRRRDALLAAACAALAAASKYPGAALVPVVGLALALNVERGQRSWRRAAATAGACALLLAGVFAAVNPYFFLSLPRVAVDIISMAMAVYNVNRPSPAAAMGRDYLVEVLGFGMGWGILFPALAEMARSLWRREAAALCLSAFCVGYFGILCVPNSLYYRYTLPLLPPLCTLSALCWSRLNASLTGLPRWGLRIAAAASLGLPAARAARMSWLLGREDTRSAALSWAQEHVPAGSRVAQEGRFGVPLAFSESQWGLLDYFAANSYRVWEAVYRYRVARSRGAVRSFRGQVLLPDMDLVPLEPGAPPLLRLAGPKELALARTDFVILSNNFLASVREGAPMFLFKALAKEAPIAAFTPFRSQTGPAWRSADAPWLERMWRDTPWAGAVDCAGPTVWRDMWDRDRIGPVIWIYDVRRLRARLTSGAAAR